MSIYKQLYKNSASEVNLAGLNADNPSFENPFLTEEDTSIGSAVQRKGTIVTFDKDAYYGTVFTPETGNISSNLVGAVLGITGCIIHNSVAEPSFGSEFIELNSSQGYVTGMLNYIFYNYIDPTKVVYSISQEI